MGAARSRPAWGARGLAVEDALTAEGARLAALDRTDEAGLEQWPAFDFGAGDVEQFLFGDNLGFGVGIGRHQLLRHAVDPFDLPLALGDGEFTHIGRFPMAP